MLKSFLKNIKINLIKLLRNYQPINALMYFYYSNRRLPRKKYRKIKFNDFYIIEKRNYGMLIYLSIVIKFVSKNIYHAL